MKNPIKYIFPAVIFLLAFSCEKNEPIKKVEDKCGENTAKFIRTWCVDYLAVIEILSNKSLGENWTNSSDGKTYNHAILATFDSVLSKSNKDWGNVIASADSIFYFNYVIKQIDNDCKLCCSPTKIISISSFSSYPCSETTNN